MSDKKKNLKDFLAKQGKKKQPAKQTTEAPADAGTTATEEAKDQTVQDAKVNQKEEAKVVKPSGKSQESSDEEEDDGVIKGYGAIQETVAQGSKKNKNEGNIFDQPKESDKPKAADAPKKKGGEITFGGQTGPPRFRRGPQKNAGFDKGLDDLDDEKAADDNKDSKHQDDSTFTNIGRQFVNLGSGARPQGGFQEEEKKETRAPAEKPRFFGKANLKGTGGGQDKDQEGVVNRSYDFKGVAIRGGENDRPREPRGEDNKREERTGTDQSQRGGVRGGRRGGRGGGRGGFGPSQAQQDEDEGFEVVRDKRKPAKKRFNQNDSDSDEEPAQGGGRGGRGRGSRGGFFTNSGKNRVQE